LTGSSHFRTMAVRQNMNFSFRRFPRVVVVALLVVKVVVVGGAIVYLVTQYQQQGKNMAKSTPQVASEADTLTQRVGRLMILPTNEKPTIATISDTKKLQQESFFAKAENGDKVLFYIHTKEAILFRPSINKIVSIAEVNNDKVAGAKTQSSLLLESSHTATEEASKR
jgi:predicted PurR-regulated permease PerM